MKKLAEEEERLLENSCGQRRNCQRRKYRLHICSGKPPSETMEEGPIFCMQGKYRRKS